MKSLLSLFLLFCFYSSFAQPNVEHHIDKSLNACLDSSENQTTAGMVGCVNTATKAWEAELDEKYNQLIDFVTDAQKKRLKASQDQWKAYCKKEIAFSNKLYADQEGSMWRIAAAQTKLRLSRQRVLAFDGYLSLFLRVGNCY